MPPPEDEDALGKPLTPWSERVLTFAFVSFFAFAIVELIFAFSTNSLSLLGDALAMIVDSATYLFNGLAMRRTRATGREDTWAVVAPAVSAAALTGAMIYVLVGAVQELQGAPDNDVSVQTVLVFGLTNLVVDGVNVGLFWAYPDAFRAVLLFAEPDSLEADGGLNLRSALTHVLADTWRSAAVVVSASLSIWVAGVADNKADAWGAIAVEAPILIMCFNIVRAVVHRYWRDAPASSAVPGGDAAAPAGDPKQAPLVGGVV